MLNNLSIQITDVMWRLGVVDGLLTRVLMHLEWGTHPPLWRRGRSLHSSTSWHIWNTTNVAMVTFIEHTLILVYLIDKWPIKISNKDRVLSSLNYFECLWQIIYLNRSLTQIKAKPFLRSAKLEFWMEDHQTNPTTLHYKNYTIFPHETNIITSTEHYSVRFPGPGRTWNTNTWSP